MLIIPCHEYRKDFFKNPTWRLKDLIKAVLFGPIITLFGSGYARLGKYIIKRS
jgi:hypothetical protein